MVLGLPAFLIWPISGSKAFPDYTKNRLKPHHFREELNHFPSGLMEFVELEEIWLIVFETNKTLHKLTLVEVYEALNGHFNLKGAIISTDLRLFVIGFHINSTYLFLINLN